MTWFCVPRTSRAGVHATCFSNIGHLARLEINQQVPEVTYQFFFRHALSLIVGVVIQKPKEVVSILPICKPGRLHASVLTGAPSGEAWQQLTAARHFLLAHPTIQRFASVRHRGIVPGCAVEGPARRAGEKSGSRFSHADTYFEGALEEGVAAAGLIFSMASRIPVSHFSVKS